MLPTNFRSEYDFRTIGRNLKRLRTENKLSAEYVKDYLRLCSVQAVYKWERGESLPQADTFIALLELYGVDSFREVLYNKQERESENSPFHYVVNFFIYALPLQISAAYISHPGKFRLFSSRSLPAAPHCPRPQGRAGEVLFCYRS